MNLICVAWFLLLRFTPDIQAKETNDKVEVKKCFLKKTEQWGLCVSVDHCDYAKELLKMKQWKRPQHCEGYIGIYPLVCCPVPRSELVCQRYYTPEDPCVKPEIFGGEKATPKEFPHMASLGYGNEVNDKKWSCGGSLISKRFVLTAGHCMKHPTYGPVRWVRLGDLDLNSTIDEDNGEAQPQDFEVSQFYSHPEYKKPERYHDIALVKLDRDARFGTFVRPACLHVELPVPGDLTITGWGKIEQNGKQSNYLLKADIYYVNHTACAARYMSTRKKYLPMGIRNNFQVCAGHPEGKDTCPGDSGGPLQYKIYNLNPHFRIVGVTSFGQACSIPGASSIAIYARVSHYLTWIQDIVWPDKEFDLNRE